MHTSKIPGVIIKELTEYHDDRGITAELFRIDELDNFQPAMGYVSYTFPKKSRGPHEHIHQTDCFIFCGPALTCLTLWDNRSLSDNYEDIIKTKESFMLNQDKMTMVIIPPGVIHGYRNCSPDLQLEIFNFPNRLYKGEGRGYPVDEIRHEAKPSNPYVLD